jgi:ATP-dependent Clp protease protease subunit
VVPQSPISRDIYLFDDINPESTRQTIARINACVRDGLEPINLYLCSDGGSVYHGLAIYSAIRLCPAPVKTIAMGCVMSMASVVFLAAPRRTIVDPCRVMIHGIWDTFEGDVKNFRNVSKENLALQRIMINIYRERTKEKTIKFWEKLVERDTYFSAREALDIGIATELI